MKKMKLDGKDIFQIIIAGFIVNDAPALFSGVTGKAFTGITEDIVGGGLGVLTGFISKTPMIINASLAFALFNIVNGILAPQLAGFLPGASVVSKTGQSVIKTLSPKTTVSDYVNLPASLGEYVSGYGSGIISGYQNYRNAYRQN